MRFDRSLGGWKILLRIAVHVADIDQPDHVDGRLSLCLEATRSYCPNSNSAEQRQCENVTAFHALLPPSYHRCDGSDMTRSHGMVAGDEKGFVASVTNITKNAQVAGTAAGHL